MTRSNNNRTQRLASRIEVRGPAPFLYFLLLPFIQIGVSFYYSIATTMALLVVWMLYPILLRARPAPICVAVVISLLMYLSLIVNGSSDFNWDFLKISREILFFLMTVTLVTGFRNARVRFNYFVVGRLALVVMSLWTLLIVTQQVAFASGIYIGLPQSWFVSNFSTLPGRETLNFLSLGISKFRAMATFGEPSYCGFIMLSIFVMFYQRARTSKVYAGIVALAVINGLLVQSMAFLLAIGVMIYVVYWAQMRGTQKAAMTLVVVISASVLLLSGAGDGGRILNLLQGHPDASTYSRVILPAVTIVPYLMDHPFGVPASGTLAALVPYTVNIDMLSGLMNNAFLNVVFFYGIVGFLLLWSVIWSGSDRVAKLYLFMSMSFNGAFFTVDKFAVICMTLFLYEIGKNQLIASSNIRRNSARPNLMSAEPHAARPSPAI